MKIGSQMHRKAVKDGVLSEDTLPAVVAGTTAETLQPPQPPQPIPQPTPQPILKEIEKEPPQDFTTQKGVAEMCSNIIAENKTQFKKLNQDETNELLRKLLYEKLYSTSPPPKETKEKKKPKPEPIEKPKKPKLKIKNYYSSSSSESDD
jgi:hypothetical protein